MTKVPTMKILVASPSVPFLPIRSAMYPDERPPKAETKLRLPTMTWRRADRAGIRAARERLGFEKIGRLGGFTSACTSVMCRSFSM